MSVGEKIKEYRERLGWTVTKLAEESGVSKAYISQIENDPDKKISADILFKLAETLSTTMAVLMGKDVPVSNVESEIPASLHAFAEKKNLSREDLQMLAGIKYRGRQPSSEIDWEYIYNMIQVAAMRRDD